MKKIKVFQLMHGYEGFISLCNEYSKAFAGPEFDVTVGYLVGAPRDEVRSETFCDRVVFFDFSRKDIRGAKVGAVLKLLKFCKKERFSIVFCHRYKPTYIMSLVNLFCPIPTLVSVIHGLGQLQRASRKVHIYLFCRHRWKFVGISDAVSEDLLASRSGLGKDNVVTIHNAVDVNHIVEQQFDSRTAREKLKVSLGSFVFGAVGRLSPDKDHKTIIQAFSIARDKMPGSKVVVVGGGRLEESLRAEIKKLSLEEDVLFAGHVPRAFRIMPGFDVLLLPSLKEGFGLVLLEAMATRLPIIASSVGGIPEVLGPWGVVVPPGQPEVLALKMIELYQLPPDQRQKLGDAGHARLIANFTSERHHAKVLRLVRRQANRPIS